MALCERAFVIGLDGLRGPAIHDVETPHIDAICREGAWSSQAQTVMPSSSYPAWGSLFHGVGPDKHLIGGETPISEDAAWPSFMKVARQAHPDWVMGAFSCWEPINRDIIEDSCGAHCESAGDPELAPAAAAFIREAKPHVFFMQLDYIDGTGHGHGYRSELYHEAIRQSDERVGLIVEAVRDIGALDESLIVVVSDHGGCEIEHEGAIHNSHGVDHPDAMTIFWSARGPGVAKGAELDGDVTITHTAPVVAHALGLPIPEGWDVQTPPPGVFDV